MLLNVFGRNAYLRRATILALAVLVLTCGIGAGTGTAQAQRSSGSGFLSEPLEPVFHALPPNIELLTLENGLPVVLMRNPAQPMVGIYAQVAVGSAHEDFRTSGMCHMLEHLLFNGTELYTQQELYDRADLAGAYNNANTSDYYTNFMMVLPADEIAVGMELQSQMLYHSLVPEEKFEKEQGIVLGELVSARDRGGNFADEVLRETIYAGSDLALPTLGTRATIANMARDDVYDFYKNWYVPNNTVLTVAGNFDRDEALTLLERHYGSVPPGTLPEYQFVAPEHIERTRTVVRRGGEERICLLAFEAPGYDAPDYFAFQVASSLLDAPGTGILTLAVSDMSRNERPQLSTWWDRGPYSGRLMLRFDLPADLDPVRCYRLVQEAVAAALDAGVTADDVAEIVAMAETETLLQREQLRMTGIYAAESLTLGGPDFFASYLPRLRGVEPDQVSRSLDHYLVDAPTLAVLIEPRPVPAGETDADASAAGDHGGMQMPEGMTMPPAMAEAMRKMRAGSGEGMDPDAVLGEDNAGAASSSAVLATALPVDRTVLNNGAVLVSQTNSASPIMAVHLTARGRAILDQTHGVPGAVNIVHRLLTGGMSGCDEACLARRLRRLGAQVKLIDDARFPMDDYYTNGRFSFVRVETAAENGLALFELLAEMTQRASFTEDQFERAREEQLALLRREQSSARRTANRMLDEALYGENPLVQDPAGDVASIEALTYDQVRAVYRKAFAPENLVIAVVSPAAHADLVAKWEELLPGRGVPTAGLPNLPVTAGAQRVRAEVGGEIAAIRLGSIITVDPADKTALTLLGAIISDRMAMDLRETRGLSYSVGTSIAVHDGEAELTAWINPPVERAAEGEEALREALSGFDPESVTQEELDRIRAARQGRAMMRRLSSMSQAYYLAMAELADDLGGYLEAISAYDRVTLEELRRVHGRYLAKAPLVTVAVN